MTGRSDDIIRLAIAVAAGLSLMVPAARALREARKRREGRPSSSPARRTFLLALSILSLMSFFRFGWLHDSYIQFGWMDKRAFLHLWDIYHYYLGAKYFPEIGYYNLYNATIAADAEDGNFLSGVRRIRDLHDYSYVPRERVLAQSVRYRSLFAPPRWEEFKADLRFFKRLVPQKVFAEFLVDHGYNPSPFWNAVGGKLANLVPADRIGWLAAIDPVLLIIMFVAIGRAFGLDAAFLSMIFFNINFFSPFTWTGGSFLRYDWLAGTVLSLCMLRMKREALAGVFLAYAAMVRIFPFLFLFGPGLTALQSLVSKGRVPDGSRRLFASFAVTCALFLGLSLLGGRQIETWRDFSARLAVHVNAPSSNNVGFKVVFLHDESCADSFEFTKAYGAKGEEPEAVYARVKGDEFDRRKRTFYLISLVILTLAAVAAAGLPNDEAFLWGMVPLFLFINVSNYYYAFLVLPIAVWCSPSAKPRQRIYAALLFLLQAAGQVIILSTTFLLRVFALGSLLVFVFLLILIGSEVSRKVLFGEEKRQA